MSKVTQFRWKNFFSLTADFERTKHTKICLRVALVAQWVERSHPAVEIQGSNPMIGIFVLTVNCIEKTPWTSQVLRRKNVSELSRCPNSFVMFYFLNSATVSCLATTTNVTRFGEISPLWQNLQSLWQFFEALFTIWQNFEPTLAYFVYFWSNFHLCHWTKCGKII